MMKSMFSTKATWLCAAAWTLAFAANPAMAIVVSTADGNGLDGEASEIHNGTEVLYGFNGTKNDMNARSNGYNNGQPFGVGELDGGDADGDDRNEYWVLRFDLSGMDKSLITGADIQLTAWRDSNLQKDLRLYGVNPTTPGFNTFDETSLLFSDVPGMVEDFDMTTISVDDSLTTYLGDFNFPNFEGDVVPLSGDLLHLTQDTLDNTGPNSTSQHGGAGVMPTTTLDNYLRSLGEDDMATFIVSGIGSNGQVRVGQKEADVNNATLENSGFICGVDFDCAPFIEFEFSTAIEGDANGDGNVDILDLDILSGNFGTMGGATLADGDFNADGNVDILDLDILSGAFGTMSSASASIPEPGTLLIGLTALALGASVRKRV